MPDGTALDGGRTSALFASLDAQHPTVEWQREYSLMLGLERLLSQEQPHLADGTELESGPGEITSLPPGHDAWVVGGEPVVAIDWQGASVWAARPA